MTDAEVVSSWKALEEQPRAPFAAFVMGARLATSRAGDRERLARALFDEGRGKWSELTWEEEPYHHEHYYRLADAALASLAPAAGQDDAGECG